MFQKRHSAALRLALVLGILTLIATAAACGPPPTPAPETLLPTAEPLCEAAFSSPVGTGSPKAPVLALLNKEYEEKRWAHERVPFVEAQSALEVQTLVCIREIRVLVGTYTDGAGGFRLDWDVRLVQWPDGTVLDANEFSGGGPPRTNISKRGATPLPQYQ